MFIARLRIIAIKFGLESVAADGEKKREETLTRPSWKQRNFASGSVNHEKIYATDYIFFQLPGKALRCREKLSFGEWARRKVYSWKYVHPLLYQHVIIYIRDEFERRRMFYLTPSYTISDSINPHFLWPLRSNSDM